MSDTPTEPELGFDDGALVEREACAVLVERMLSSGATCDQIATAIRSGEIHRASPDRSERTQYLATRAANLRVKQQAEDARQALKAAIRTRNSAEAREQRCALHQSHAAMRFLNAVLGHDGWSGNPIAEADKLLLEKSTGGAPHPGAT